MPEQPIPSAYKSLALEVEAGTHWWCSCGRSSNQPFCDGSHKGTGLQAFKFEVSEKKTLYFCMCKATKNPPFCDGSHKLLTPPQP